MKKTDRSQDVPVMLTVPELAELLRVGRNAAYDLVRCGAIRSIRIGHKIRIPRQAVCDFLAG